MRDNQYFDDPGHGERPILSLEVRPMPDEDPEKILDQSKKEFLKAWDFFKNEV
jgi:hypothetical protein